MLNSNTNHIVSFLLCKSKIGLCECNNKNDRTPTTLQLLLHIIIIQANRITMIENHYENIDNIDIDRYDRCVSCADYIQPAN